MDWPTKYHITILYGLASGSWPHLRWTGQSHLVHHLIWTGQSNIRLPFYMGWPVGHGLISDGLASLTSRLPFYMGWPVGHVLISDGLTGLSSYTILNGLANHIHIIILYALKDKQKC